MNAKLHYWRYEAPTWLRALRRGLLFLSVLSCVALFATLCVAIARGGVTWSYVRGTMVLPGAFLFAELLVEQVGYLIGRSVRRLQRRWEEERDRRKLVAARSAFSDGQALAPRAIAIGLAIHVLFIVVGCVALAWTFGIGALLALGIGICALTSTNCVGLPLVVWLGQLGVGAFCVCVVGDVLFYRFFLARRHG